MKLETVKVPAIVLSVCVVIVALLVLFKPEQPRVEIEVKPLLVDAVEVKRKALQVTVNAQGVVAPRTQTDIVAEVSGKIVSVADNFVVGGFFDQGDLLVKTDDTRYIAQLKQAEAAVATARSHLIQEEGRAKVALNEWNTRHNRDTLDSTAKSLALREPQIEEAKAQLASAIAQRKQAQKDLDNTEIRSPYRGLIKAKHVDISQFITSGTPIATTFAVDVAEVRLPVGENQLPYLSVPDKFATSAPRDYGNVLLTYQIDDNVYKHQAKVVRSEGVLDADSRVLYLVAQVNDPYQLGNANKDDALLRIGTFVDAEITGKTIADLIELPRNILRPGNKLWVIDDNELLQQRVVETLRTSGSNMLVSAGLEDGDIVCLTSVGPVLPGTPVRVDQLTSQQQPSSLENESKTLPGALAKEAQSKPLGGV